MTGSDLHSRLVSSLTARLERAREQFEDPQRWPAEIWWHPEHHAVSVEVNGAKRFRTWLVREAGPLRTTWEWHPPDGAYLLLNPEAEIRRVEATLRVVQRHRPISVPGGRWTCDADFDAGQMGYPCPDIVDIAAGEGIEP